MRKPTTRPAWALVTTAAVLVSLPALASPAHAAPPANDAIRGAIVTTTDPSTVSFDTTEATADPDDGRCVGDRSVWFRFDATTTRSLRMTTAGSDFDTRLAIFRGTRNERRLVDCDNNNGPGRTSADRFRILEGQRYWVAVSSCCEPHPGGSATLTIGRFAEPGAEITVEGARSGEISGRLFVDGTIACDTPSEARLEVTVSQRVGDAVARGTAYRRLRRCDDGVRDWTAGVDSETGWAFGPGPVSVRVNAYVYDGISSATATESASPVAVSDPDARVAR